MPVSSKLTHVVLPRELRRSRPVNVSARTRDSHRLPVEVGLDLTYKQAEFLDWVFALSNLDARSYRPETMRRRLTACLRTLRVADVASARRILEATPELIASVMTTMLVGVTAFNRDTAVFETLRTEIVPALAEPRGGLFAWSAGCSEGAEVYSAAILLSDLGLLRGSYLLGTDCRSEAIQKAREGYFDECSLKALTPHQQHAYFLRDGLRMRVCESLRRAVRWRVANLLSMNEPGYWDLIFFRNTAMYLRSECTDLLWERMESSLRPGGILVLGKAERPLGAKRLALVAPCIYRRTRK